MFEFIGNQGVIVDLKFEIWLLASKAGIKENLIVCGFMMELQK